MQVGDRVEVRLLGRPAVAVDGARFELIASKTGAILAYLAFHGGWVGREELVYLLWPDVPEERARGNLRPLVSRLIRTPYGAGVERERTRLRWSVPTDLQRFREALQTRRWREAWDLGRQGLLTGFGVGDAGEFENWLEAERAELRGLAGVAAMRAAEESSVRGDDVAASEVLAELHRTDPLDEEVVRSYVASLARSGARREGLAVFDRFRRALAAEVGGEPEAATVAAIEALRSRAELVDTDHGGARQQSPGAASAGGGMPIQPTRFVGRVAERTVVAARLAEEGCRLLTLVGPGGVGKTRLAIEVAGEEASRFRDGACFVDLADAATDAAIAPAVAGATGLRLPESGDALEHLLRHLRRVEMLLVLDNLEHLVGRNASIAAVIAAAPSVKIIATSRSPLGLRGERLFDLGGMALEDDQRGGASSDAVTLFVRAGRRVRQEPAEAGSAELRSIATICRLVGGLPLALEIAASWLRVLTLDEIERELGAGLDLLEGRQAGTKRHAGMRAVFEHSWSLLRPDERDALRALSVFRGGWSREAAWAVAAVGMPMLLALVDASLIRREPSGRFVWHPLVGQYAAARAAELEAQREQVAARHARYFVELAAERRDAFKTLDGARLLGEIVIELANMRAAWNWCVAERREDMLAAAVWGVHYPCFTNNRLNALLAMLRSALPVAAPGGLLEGRLLIALGGVSCIGNSIGGYRESIEGLALLEQGLAIVEELEAESDVAAAVRFLAAAHGFAGRVTEARRLWERLADLYRSLGDSDGLATVLTFFGIIEPRFEDAVRHFRAGAQAAREADEPHALAMADAHLGGALFAHDGASAKAAEALARAVELHAKTGFHYYGFAARMTLAQLHADQGAFAAARSVLDQAPPQAGDDAPVDQGVVHAIRGWIDLLEGDGVGAASWCRAALDCAQQGEASAQTEARCHGVLAALALEGGDPDCAAREIALARRALDGVARAPSDRRRVRRGDTMIWVRLLACAVEISLAGSRSGDARGAVTEALTIAAEAEQQPAAAVALVAAARLLATGGDHTVARELAVFVSEHVSAPFDARSGAKALLERWRVVSPGTDGLPEWLGGVAVAAAGATLAAAPHDRSLLDLAERVSGHLRSGH